MSHDMKDFDMTHIRLKHGNKSLSIDSMISDKPIIIIGEHGGNSDLRTYHDLFREIYRRYGIRTSAEFHCDPNKRISDEEYQNLMVSYSLLQATLLDKLGKEEKKNE